VRFLLIFRVAYFKTYSHLKKTLFRPCNDCSVMHEPTPSQFSTGKRRRFGFPGEKSASSLFPATFSSEFKTGRHSIERKWHYLNVWVDFAGFHSRIKTNSHLWWRERSLFPKMDAVLESRCGGGRLMTCTAPNSWLLSGRPRGMSPSPPGNYQRINLFSPSIFSSNAINT